MLCKFSTKLQQVATKSKNFEPKMSVVSDH